MDMKEKRDQCEELQDFLDTLLEEADPEFQRSLRKATREIKRAATWLTLSSSSL